MKGKIMCCVVGMLAMMFLLSGMNMKADIVGNGVTSSDISFINANGEKIIPLMGIQTDTDYAVRNPNLNTTTSNSGASVGPLTLPQSGWPQFHRSRPKDGAQISSGIINSHFITKSLLSNNFRSSSIQYGSYIVTAGEYTIGGTYQGSVYCFNSALNVYWSLPQFGGPIRATPAFSQDGTSIYVWQNPQPGLTGAYLWKLRASDGAIQNWVYTSSGAFSYSAIADIEAGSSDVTTPRVYITYDVPSTGYGYLLQFSEDLNTLYCAHQFPTTFGQNSMSSPAVRAGTDDRDVYIGNGNIFYSLDEYGLTVYSTFTVSGTIHGTPSVDTNEWPMVYVIADSSSQYFSTIYKLSSHNGYVSQVWYTRVIGDYASSPANYGNKNSGGMVYFTTFVTESPASSYFYQLNKGSGYQGWCIQKSLGFTPSIAMIPSPAITYDSNSNQLYAYFVVYRALFAYTPAGVETQILIPTVPGYAIYSSPAIFVDSESTCYLTIGEDGGYFHLVHT